MISIVLSARSTAVSDRRSSMVFEGYLFTASPQTFSVMPPFQLIRGCSAKAFIPDVFFHVFFGFPCSVDTNLGYFSSIIEFRFSVVTNVEAVSESYWSTLCQHLIFVHVQASSKLPWSFAAVHFDCLCMLLEPLWSGGGSAFKPYLVLYVTT